MTGPSSTPRPERAGRPGVTWNTVLIRAEEYVEDTSGPDANEPLPPRPNRETRRAMQRAARRKK